MLIRFGSSVACTIVSLVDSGPVSVTVLLRSR